MRRIIAVLFLCAAAFTTVYASTNRVVEHQVPVGVMFRTHSTSFQTRGQDEQGGPYVDSTTFSKTGAAAADTTVAISLMQQPAVTSMTGSATATTLLDTTAVYGRLFLMPTNSPATCGLVDTLYVTTQWSADKKNWIQQDSEVNTQGNILVNTQTGAGALSPVFALVVRNSASSNGLDVHLTRCTRGFPYVRFIVRDKVASTTVIHNFAALWVTYNSGEELDGQP